MLAILNGLDTIHWGAPQSQALAMWITAVLLGVALWYSKKALGEVEEAKKARQEAQKSRHTATHIAMAMRWETEEMTAGRQAAAAYKTPLDLKSAVIAAHTNNTDEYYCLVRVPNFFEIIAGLVDKEGLPVEVVKSSWCTLILHNWDHWAPAIREMRDLRGAPTIWTGFEGLAGQMKDTD